MQLLKEKIVKDGVIRGNNIVKVDSFLNHQIDINLLNEIGKEFRSRFDGLEVNKILTIEASGIAVACIASQHFGNPPVVFAKKSAGSNLSDSVYSSSVYSYTKDKTFNVMVDKSYLSPEDKVLIVDDFLANGNAAKGLAHLVEQSGATLVGIGIVIEKGFQNGRQIIIDQGIKLESLAIVKSIEDGEITFA